MVQMHCQHGTVEERANSSMEGVSLKHLSNANLSFCEFATP